MLQFVTDFLMLSPVVESLLILTIVVAIGVFLGNTLTIRSMSLGVTWVLFVGLACAALGGKIDPTVEQFVRDFGLVLFIYSLGLQVGPSFFSSFSHGGLKLNLLALAIVLLGVGVTIGVSCLTGEEMASMVGVMAGAVTNTPAMGAAQQAYLDLFHESNPHIATGYALAYPFSILGVIMSIIIMRKFFHVNLHQQEQILHTNDSLNDSSPVCVDICLSHPEVINQPISALRSVCSAQMVVSRIIHPNSKEEVANSRSVLRAGDVIRVLTDHAHLEQLHTLGELSVFQSIPKGDSANLVSRRIVVTKPEWNGERIGKVSLRAQYNVTITRVVRAGIDLLATPNLMLQLGDRLVVVGEQDDVKRVGELFGNELKKLDAPNLMPVFLGIALGVIVGTFPIVLPGLGQVFRLGLAGGTLLVALLVGRFGPTYRMVTFSTTSANRMLREVGLSIFLAAVGLGAGETFLPAILSGGYMWIFYGLLITMVPLLVVGFVSYKWLHLDFFSLMGLFTGACNDAPALAYAISLSPNNDQASVSYATVYPMTMFLRVLTAQLMIIFFT